VAKTKRPAERSEPSRLCRPLAEAEAAIDERIRQGDAIRATLTRGPLSQEAKAWHEKNEALLQRLFTEPSEYEQYRMCVLSGSGGPMIAFRGSARDDDETRWHEIRLQWLRSLRGRLDVYEAAAPAEPGTVGPTDVAPLSREVFVVHGHDEASKLHVARVLERLGLTAIVLHEQPDAGRTIIEKFEDHANVGYAVVLLTPDDESGSTRRARQNVILELGYFLGRLGRGKVRALYKPGVELPSDLHGWLYTLMDEGGAWKFKLGTELRTAGFDVDLNRLV